MNDETPPEPRQTLVKEIEELGYNGCLTGDCPHDTQAECDAALAAAIAEISVVATLRSRVTTLRSALENWGRHFAWCDSRDSTKPCNCGLADALSVLENAHGH